MFCKCRKYEKQIDDLVNKVNKIDETHYKFMEFNLKMMEMLQSSVVEINKIALVMKQILDKE